MATFIYRRASSTSARSLSQAVRDGIRWRRLDRRTPVAGDTVVCWGEAAPATLPQGVLVINGAPIRNKFEDAQRLIAAGVPTIEVARTRPAAIAAVAAVDPAIAAWTTAQDLAEDFTEIETFARNPVMTRGVQQLIDALMGLNGALNRPIPVATPGRNTGEWLGRSFNHVGGNDLLTPPATADYWSRKLTLVDEFRIHSFDGRSIRAGRKMLREGYDLGTATTIVPQPPHGANLRNIASPWIRSFDGGWRIVYDNFESSRPLRDLAASAVSALGLNFGAVDIGQLVGGSFVVLEVNRAPGLEGGSVGSYATAVDRYSTDHANGARAVRAAA